MSLTKIVRDYAIKFLFGKESAPRGLVDLNRYFRIYGPINFVKHQEGEVIVAVSTDFNQGSIITEGRNEEELEANIKDAILTAFEVPSSYAKEAGIHQVGKATNAYAPA
ncbi:hypothetical protein JW899_01400 [Candidatus Uhrbacteria bacterium]|nr:hypothetical protein [Candidatus Uhrbacteria bacterium]